ncbi:hypothetical protein ERD95_02170 [Enterobacteriaceae bacterium ML5]|nr:hypothetical protein ERD95_02170 [Enterobacteriaceae bacterium ML5]
MKNLTNERLKEIIAHRSPSLRWGEAEAMASELLVLRPGEVAAVTAESAPAYLLGLMDQVKACNTPEELRELRSRVNLSDLNTAIGSIDQAIEKLSNL